MWGERIYGVKGHCLRHSSRYDRVMREKTQSTGCRFSKSRIVPQRCALPLILAAAGLALSNAQEPRKQPGVDATAPATPPSSGTQGEIPMTIQISSPAFRNGESIPKRHTGDGEDVSPALSWSGVPAGVKELAVICDDPDAPTPEPWVHWVVGRIPGEAKGLPENIAKTASPPDPKDILQGRNSFGKVGYGGPAPPKGHGVHHYHFKLYALDGPIAINPGLDKKALLAAMKGHILAQGELIGTYERR